MPTGGGVADTVTVALDVTLFAPLIATRLYVVVAVGLTPFEPFSATEAPSRYTAVALLLVQFNVDAWPAWIVVGVAVTLPRNTVELEQSSSSPHEPPPDEPPDTVTVAVDVTRWSSSTATSV
ncbi:MAG: hypothetical protein DMF93_03490 [Acidobacteria bacterium]|nr:MAG: hypothetical protein DMF93_03490 [Acidobacteriota bacterium]